MGVLSGELFTKYFIEHCAAGFRVGQSDPSFRTSFGIDVSYFKCLHRVRTITLVNRSVKVNEPFVFALKKHGRSIYLYRPFVERHSMTNTFLRMSLQSDVHSACCEKGSTGHGQMTPHDPPLLVLSHQ